MLNELLNQIYRLTIFEYIMLKSKYDRLAYMLKYIIRDKEKFLKF